jgi:peptide/nickel transport system ATP-binding protein
MALLDVVDLQTRFHGSGGTLYAVNNLSFSIERGETLALVGESGSGKSVACMSIMRLLRAPPAEILGRVMFEGRDLLSLTEREMRRVRGKDISMVFQEPMSSLNPTLTIGRQITEALKLHEGISTEAARKRAAELLDLVGISAAAQRLGNYPHEFSGGMRQRVMISIALACTPKLLIADEPTTALDVTIQAQIMDLMSELKRTLHTTTLLITHDLGVVAEMADRVVVMYAGRAVEQARVRELFSRPAHPYTRGLIGAMPQLSAHPGQGPRGDLIEIPGRVPSLRSPIVGCAFANRCGDATDLCREIAPRIEEQSPGHFAACHHVQPERQLERAG